MRIALDAKRAYHNDTGLGNYSRTLISDLSLYFPANEYFLFNPKKSDDYSFKEKNIHQILPEGFLSKKIPSLWRSRWMIKDLTGLNIDLYHGLSHEIPVGIQHTGVKSVVTIHDLIFERFPNQYRSIDVKIYQRKFKYACRHADRIIAISEQTKRDIIDFYQIDPDKIDVRYQSCGSDFNPLISEIRKRSLTEKFNLPERFFLSVGTIIERKNLLNVCRAMRLMDKCIAIPLVVVGGGSGEYRQKVNHFIQNNELSDKIIFLSDISISELPVIYSLAEALIYPSYFEGFGIPILEALSVGIPVITSSVSCLPEAGGDAALYVNPDDPQELAECMVKVLSDKDHAHEMIERGFVQAEKFSNKHCADKVMETYTRLVR